MVHKRGMHAGLLEMHFGNGCSPARLDVMVMQCKMHLQWMLLTHSDSRGTRTEVCSKLHQGECILEAILCGGQPGDIGVCLLCVHRQVGAKC